MIYTDNFQSIYGYLNIYTKYCYFLSKNLWLSKYMFSTNPFSSSEPAMIMATITNISTSFNKYNDHSSSKTLLLVPKLALPFALNPLKPSYSRCRSKHASLFCSAVHNSPLGDHSRHDPEKPRGDSDILVESLERQGVETVFTYRGSESEQGVETLETLFAYIPPWIRIHGAPRRARELLPDPSHPF